MITSNHPQSPLPKFRILFLFLFISLTGIPGILCSQPFHSESWKSLTFDGAWCWFSDPRAVYYEGEYQRTYAGWIDSHGDVIIASYDHQSGEIQSRVLEDGYQIDDHDNPALLFRPDGRLMVFFTKHGGDNPTLLFTMKEPEDLSAWKRAELFLNDKDFYPELNSTNTYVNPVMLSEENNRIYLFWRGMDNKPNYSFSDDLGETWSMGRILINPDPLYPMRRPYVKVSSNGKDRIWFVFTDGHPRREPQNSIYCIYYEKGSLHKVTGEEIRQLGDEPVHPGETSRVYDASVSGAKAWIWDVTQDEEDRPVLVYARFPDDLNHIYSYSRWNGKKWESEDLVNSGSWFPETPEGETEREPNYSGGIVLDHEDPNTVYVSVTRDSVFEIEMMTRKRKGKWTTEAITTGSDKDNIRPFAIRNAGPGNPLQLLWMQNTRYVHYTDYLSTLKMSILPETAADVYDPEYIRTIMEQTAHWQLANPFTRASRLDWHWGAFYTGLMALYETSGNDLFRNEMMNIGQSADWKLMNQIFHADRLTIADMFIWLHGMEKDPVMIDKSRWAMDIHIARHPKADVRFENNDYRFEWWTWCDALYMAPPSFARMYQETGEEKYLDYAIEHWKITADYLYSPEDSLFYRDDRFFDDTTANGKKVFWGRGNGWVIAGLARMLDIIPASHPERAYFENQFREMAGKLLNIQRPHHLWTASLLDPEQLPSGESSASSFFTYALAWGINQGLLDESEYQSAVLSAWKALCQNVNEWGRLGFVQQVAGSPYPFFEDQWQVYATGAFLLCGKEMLSLVSR